MLAWSANHVVILAQHYTADFELSRMESLLVKESPLLLPLNKEKTVYDGFITVQERDFRIRILLPPDHQLKLAKLVSIDTEFRTLRLRAEDSSGRQHVVTVKLKPKHPVEAPWCSADLPVPLAMTWTPQSSLGHVHTQFLLLLESLAEFWAVLDEIDEKTWVLEPEKPSRADTMRRIAIANNVSIKVEVDTQHPKMLPECCLLGAEHVVTPLRNKLNANMHLWNPDCSILQNLRDVLEIEFPSPATHEKSSFSAECGICYAYRLESAIPDQVCNDPRCGQPFHQACLYEWLRGLPSSRQSFNIVFGECPYCSKPITVKMSTQKP
ncbi:E3 ubiquitin-protein ligase FANCL isoform X4 [Oncorhynchus keta]|uniref:E3 ubiquitin-protein ligase FANCL isoform X4 n=1 Tax=Oncorhynchus keta TaxID=8018 RepID=UPI00227A0E9C|nr:E3 ubiquitin-protein ligase FANCL isoform X4 [Oncorhynchus keta]